MLREKITALTRVRKRFPRNGPAEAARPGIRGHSACYGDISYYKAATLWLTGRAKSARSVDIVTLLPHLVPTQPQCGATVPAWGAGRTVRKRIYRWIIGLFLRRPGRPHARSPWRRQRPCSPH